MANKKFIILGFCLCFFFCFAFVNSVVAGDSTNININDNNDLKLHNTVVKGVNSLNYDDDDDDDDYWDDDDEDEDDDYWDDDEEDEDEDDEDYDDYDDEDEEDNYYEFIWKNETYYIDLNQFNLTDDELTELFIKRDALMEEIDILESKMFEMENSRNNDTLALIDEFFSYLDSFKNNLTIVNNNNSYYAGNGSENSSILEFINLLSSLKDMDINDVNSSFEELKSLLILIKAEYPNENFTEIDNYMVVLGESLEKELEEYEKLKEELELKLEELYELFDKYPFLMQHTKYDNPYDTGAAGGEYKTPNNVSAKMKNTGVSYYPLIILVLIIFTLFGLMKRKELRLF